MIKDPEFLNDDTSEYFYVNDVDDSDTVSDILDIKNDPNYDPTTYPQQ